MNIIQWENNINEERKLKDDFFKENFQSPLSFDEKQKFKGLNYYLPDIVYQFELDLLEHKEKKILKIEDTQGNERDLLRWGEFNFTINNTACKLQAYKSSNADETLFIPFKDATSGKETYGAGRYLDIDVEKHKTLNGKWILDFNQAYNPWCAYSNNYACPYTPSENWLKVSIKAGEKNYIKEEN